jgi:hypothetical protein
MFGISRWAEKSEAFAVDHSVEPSLNHFKQFVTGDGCDDVTKVSAVFVFSGSLLRFPLCFHDCMQIPSTGSNACPRDAVYRILNRTHSCM